MSLQPNDSGRFRRTIQNLAIIGIYCAAIILILAGLVRLLQWVMIK
jgi:hypothetical protein